MSHAAAPVSSSSLPSDSVTPTAGRASVAPDEPTPREGSQSHSARTAAIAGSVGGVCALFVILLVAVLLWRRRKRRLLREQQIAIRRMTIVGPPSAPSSPPVLPYPFLGYGPRPGRITSDFEMSTGRASAVSKPQEAGLPKTKPPVPPRSNLDTVVRRNEQTPATHSSPGDSASVFSSKQSDAGDSDGIAYAGGTYVLALDRINDRHSAEREASLT